MEQNIIQTDIHRAVETIKVAILQTRRKVMMKENGMSYSMASFKEIMASTYIAKLIFDKCRRIPNRKLISHTIKELFGWQRKTA